MRLICLQIMFSVSVFDYLYINYSSFQTLQDYVFVTESHQGLLQVYNKTYATDSLATYTLGSVPYGIVMYDEDQQPGDPGILDILHKYLLFSYIDV